MEISILGCGGSRGKNSRPTAFLIDGTLLIDCGTATEVLEPEDYAQINHILVTHSHIDHIGDLPFLAEVIFDLREDPIVLFGIQETKRDIASHILNGRIWPNFSRIPNRRQARLSYKVVNPLEVTEVNTYKVLPIPVNHTIPTVGYLIDDRRDSIAFAADTCVTDSFWEVIRAEESLRAVIIEASFPNRLEDLARMTGHLTPGLLAGEIKKLNREGVEVFVSHIKPVYRNEVIKELKNLSEEMPLQVLEDGMRINL